MHLLKTKTVNDPVHGFITIPSTKIMRIIEHPYFQRLRYIKQLGMTDLVYPGAVHSRFNHALGAFHLMSLALKTLKTKGVAISPEEEEASLISILIHDIGHGPFSHALEENIINVKHEEISEIILKKINQSMNNELDLALDFFTGNYSRLFFKQLVAGQLDVDRLDYLSRDSFFTGVVEGMIGLERLLSLINVVDDELVFEEKALISIEKFLISRRLMYGQVYFHKTVLSAEILLKNTLNYAKYIANEENVDLQIDEKPDYFFRHNTSSATLENDSKILDMFCLLDDSDIFNVLKKWRHHSDPLLAFLSSSILERNLYKTISDPSEKVKEDLTKKCSKWLIDRYQKVDEFRLNKLILSLSIADEGYQEKEECIKILNKKGEVVPLSKAISTPLTRYFAEPIHYQHLFYFPNL